MQCLSWPFDVPSESPFTESVGSALWKCHAGIDCDGVWLLRAKQKSVSSGTSFTGCKWEPRCLVKGKGLRYQVAWGLAGGGPQVPHCQPTPPTPPGFQLPSSCAHTISSHHWGDRERCPSLLSALPLPYKESHLLCSRLVMGHSLGKPRNSNLLRFRKG